MAIEKDSFFFKLVGTKNLGTFMIVADASSKAREVSWVSWRDLYV
jgi:hypothetical protein